MATSIITRRSLVGGVAAGAIALWLGTSSHEAAARSFPETHTPGEWKRLLGDQRYNILREGGTEWAGSSALDKEHRKGTFACAGCAQPLFASATKFDSGTGWPSFWRPLDGAVFTRTDRSLGSVREEVLCARCGGHLGHVFNDGPRPTGLRYCMNGLAMRFRPA